ncbi:MBOAT family O-acyltransferase [Helicobacter canis]|uniref:MBOAT family protein n=1 Tax=Helicobacter canis NCTC 12740 TaxID=1357399 RepID=V8CHL6_9HELI|nr:MBOAT family O-acyltransferase [Helicobacter canis]ETD26495.1 hypothetical protein HMPREF2087_00876 [Helicobacter canis NCTC 12740]
MDCHATADALARNDSSFSHCERSEAIYTNKVDSSKSLSDSEIVDEKTRQSRSFFSKCGLQAKAQGGYLDGNDRRAFVQLPHLSSKAESLTTQKLSAKTLLTLGIIFNLCLLGIFKYTDFFLENFNLFSKLLALDFTIPLPHILLPLALSFVTFQQIAFLVDCYKQVKAREEAKRLESNIESNRESQKSIQESIHINFLDYCLFITFFPQLIAGPIVHHREMMPQFYKMSRRDSVLGESLSLRGDTIAEAIHTKTQKLDSSMDCHADKSARNDRKNAIGEKVDFRSEAQNLHKQAKDSRICDEKSGLSSDWQGSYLDGNDRRQSCRIADLSRKAESTKKAESLHIINWEYMAKGLFIFSIGLFKKVVIADSFAKWANAGFSAVENGAVLNCLESWATSLSYTFQLYFDFSGYCDMAIGLGLLFGIVLPINFSSPYRALNIATFWRKWHITLGRFLKEYLYIPLGGNQNIKRVVSLSKQSSKLESKQSHSYRETLLNNLLTLRNLFIVAFLSGVWHGAGWGFVIWGSLHGIAMVVHRIYMLMYKKLDSKVKDCACSDKAGHLDFKSLYIRFMGSRIYLMLCWILTFNFINIAWVFFRAENLQGAVNLLKGMFFGEVVLPRLMDSGTVSTNSIEVWGWIFLAFILALACKNSIALSAHISKARIIFAGVGCAICLLKIIGDSGASSPFLYFNF